jgi:hypothetical protein
MNGRVVPVLKHHFTGVWRNRSITFMHYVVVSDSIMLLLLYFEKRTPSTTTTWDMMALQAVELYSSSP